jgi:hypothetical protein
MAHKIHIIIAHAIHIKIALKLLVEFDIVQCETQPCHFHHNSLK